MLVVKAMDCGCVLFDLSSIHSHDYHSLINCMHENDLQHGIAACRSRRVLSLWLQQKEEKAERQSWTGL